jgi:hypothetical protein
MSTVVHQDTVPADTTGERGGLGDIFRRYGAAYAATHTLTPAQGKAIPDLARCRTAALGGHAPCAPDAYRGARFGRSRHTPWEGTRT